ncbi:beta-1,6-N-acetylglucosaminyltransferase [Nocardioides KLBMP 9356]|uniref:Peptide O-xylosyltransferase n=1 Tax=Nocardioides potassii TaxID=2911371 RepID=A0ABS9H7N7_9ACTN|nr:beta-1,6-N-acetylglucosaminyltransferase [Nocardioides potassii]MCF6376287.1 beta-1,6-N-acetylglucosaminyltransferase [Nocardioides potassii]
MRKHYLVLAHDQPDHVGRLVERLDDGEVTFWIHLDARADDAEWRAVLARPHVEAVTPRVRCVWGTWSMVEATLAMVRACLGDDQPGHLVMLSGQSYPIKNSWQIDAYLSSTADIVSMDLWNLEERWPDNYRDRLDYFCIPMSEDKGNIRLLRPRREMNARELIGWTRRLVRETGVRRAIEVLHVIGRHRPDVRAEIVGGSQWWAMPWHTAQEMMVFHESHPEYAEFFRWSQFPDESFFQTVLSAMDPDLATRVGPTLTHVDWTDGDWDLPRVMSTADVPTLLEMPDHTLFARKFLAGISDEARDAVDAAVDQGSVR